MKPVYLGLLFLPLLCAVVAADDSGHSANETVPASSDHDSTDSSLNATVPWQPDVDPVRFINLTPMGETPFGGDGRSFFGGKHPGSRKVVASLLQGLFLPNGFMTEAAYCPEDMWVNGVEMRREGHQKTRDDTAMNAVRLLCAPIGAAANTRYQNAQAHEGKWGDWCGPSYCTDSSIVVGYNLRVEGYRFDRDNTAATHLQMRCSNGMDKELDGGHPWGSWQGMQTCPRGSAVCGLSVFFQREAVPSGGIPFDPKDDVGLMGVDMKCCEFTFPDACRPTDSWKEIQRCSAENEDAALDCEYTRKIGVSTSTSHTTGGSVQDEKTLKLAMEVGGEVKGLSAKFSTEIGTSTTTENNWSQTSSKTFDQVEETKTSFKVPVGKCLKLMQVVGQCGPSEVFTGNTKLVPC